MMEARDQLLLEAICAWKNGSMLFATNELSRESKSTSR